MERKSLYDAETYQEVTGRINSISPTTGPEWGEMNAAQMFAHCAEAQEVANGQKSLEKTPLIARLFRGFIRKAVYGDAPFRKGTQTHPQYRQTEERDFEKERKRLHDSLQAFVEMDEARAARIEHPLFGRTSREERGWGMYKHLDHHLRQFGV